MAQRAFFDTEIENLVLKQEKPVVSGVVCVFIHVRDVAKSKKWYLDHLGIDFDQEGPNCGSINLGLWPHPDPEPSKQPLFVLDTPDLAETYRIMKENGVNVLGEINWYCRSFDFTDPDGNVIAMWERDEEAILNLRDIQSAEQLHQLIKSRLYLKSSYRQDWESFEEILLSCHTISQRRIVVQGWEAFQSTLPDEAKTMVDLITKHNSRYPTHQWTLEVRED